MDLNPPFLLYETLRKGKQSFSKNENLLNLKIRHKLGWPNIQLMVFSQSTKFLTFFVMIKHLNQNWNVEGIEKITKTSLEKWKNISVEFWIDLVESYKDWVMAKRRVESQIANLTFDH